MKNIIKITLALVLIPAIFCTVLNAQNVEDIQKREAIILNSAETGYIYDMVDEALGPTQRDQKINVNPLDENDVSAFEIALKNKNYLIAEYILTAEKIQTLRKYQLYSDEEDDYYSHFDKNRQIVFKKDTMKDEIKKLEKEKEKLEQELSKRMRKEERKTKTIELRVLEKTLAEAKINYVIEINRNEKAFDKLYQSIADEINTLKKRQEQIISEWGENLKRYRLEKEGKPIDTSNIFGN
ncbi:MAG: hypothetical protein HOF38_04435 [Elusimicrobiaceae bacterium]|jgi:hypothetical protein|nr:hypothetical protein [Elusimicrobiaceae bacterium]MBT3955384.1 hypothetical protein [Elusimicrobiaceae bacterium]MBT4007661.1 hypothetical protein [Elusimicrobiaceae bacterium]MBT4402329.1 hypothetical protein [Elusimicrobiaceae bacterium]MBT4439562.1 hypothetical protein [Elusimicrobiaceae bacterium]